jgi:two-component system nitrate/nitrite response regulator NarL
MRLKYDAPNKHTLVSMIAPASTFVRSPGLDRPALLSPAEQDVLSHLLAGLSNKEIASALNKAEPTVKHQVSSILRKFRQPSRARLIAFHRF